MSENKELIPKDTDDSLDTLLENMKLTQPEDLDELIEKRVNRRIRQIVLKVLAVILIPVIMIRMVISPLMNAMNINPDQMNRDFETDESGNIILESTLYRTLDAWIETQFPYTELDWVTVEKQGFGNYSIDAHVLDLKQPVAIGDSANVRFSMKTGTLLFEQNFSNINKFRRDFVSAGWDIPIEKGKEEIAAFPDSSWIFAAVSLKAPAEIKALLEMENDDLSIDWAQVYAKGSELACGINLNHVIRNDPEGVRDQLSSEELKQLFLARLALLKSEENIFTQRHGIGSMNASGGATIYSPQTSVALIAQFMETIEGTEGFAAQNFYVSGTKNAILKLLDSLDTAGVRIVDARLYRG